MNARIRFSRFALGLAVGALAIALVGPALAQAAEATADLVAIVNSMPDCDPNGKHTGPDIETAQKAVDFVLKGGKKHIIALVGMLKEPGKGDDYKAHYLLHATATYARRPGAEEERQVVCAALHDAIQGKPTFVKGHVLEELKWIGGKESIPVVSQFLTDKDLYDFAVQALVVLKASEPIRAALPKATGRNRLALIQAVGTLGDAEAVPAVVKAAASSDPDVKLNAVEALAELGDPRGVDAVLAAAELKTHSYTEMKSAEAALRLAAALGKAGKKADAQRIYATLPKQCPGKAGRHIRIGCLRGLAAVAGDEILTELISALADTDLQVRSEAARIATELPGGALVDKWLGLLKGATPKDRSGILFVLGVIGDAKALPTILESMKDKDQAVREAAVRAAGGIDSEQAVTALVACASGEDAALAALALGSLTRSKCKTANALVGKGVGQAGDESVRAELIGVLAARRAGDQIPVLVASAKDKDAGVRIAAAKALELVGGDREAPVLITMLKTGTEGDERRAAESALMAVGQRARRQIAKIIVPALDGAQPEAAGALFRVLARAGGGDAAKALATAAKSSDLKIADGAVRALAKWSERDGIVEASDGLLAIASTSKNATHQVLALRAYVDLARSHHWRRDKARRLTIYRQAIPIAKRAEEKRSILGGLSDVHDVESVKLAATLLEDKEVAEEAATAVVRIVNRVGDKTNEGVQAALATVVKTSKNKRTVSEARKFLIKDSARDPVKGLE